MQSQANTRSEKQHNRTAIAVLVAIFSVILGLFPAHVVVTIYSFMLSAIIGISGASWIPFFDTLTLTWFPELMRGMISGAIAIIIARYFFKNCNLEVVRFATLAFWGALILFSIVALILAHGWSSELISSIALLTGLGLGLWIAPEIE